MRSKDFPLRTLLPVLVLSGCSRAPELPTRTVEIVTIGYSNVRDLKVYGKDTFGLLQLTEGGHIVTAKLDGKPVSLKFNVLMDKSGGEAYYVIQGNLPTIYP